MSIVRCRFSHPGLVLVCLSGVAVLNGQPAPPTTSSYFTDQQPSVTINGAQVVLHKELSGYGNYGLADGAADILYTGQAATWHFSLPSSITLSEVQGASFTASLVADDHGGGPSPYKLAVWVDGAFLSNGLANLPYGTPFGSRFNDWVSQNYTVTTISQPYTLTLQNTSNAGGGDWIAVDWIELHLTLSQGTILPNQGGNTGSVTATIVGSNLTTAATVKLTGIGADIIGQNVTVPGNGALTATFDLTGTAPGLRSLVIVNTAGTTTVPNAFTVEQGGAPDVWVDLIAWSRLRAGQPQQYFIGCGNRGNVDAPTSRIWISFPTYIHWDTLDQLASAAGQINGYEFVAFDATLSAGSFTEIPILLTAPDNPAFAHQIFQVQVWREQ